MRLFTFFIFALFAISGCISKPEGIQPVKDFRLDRYLGTWYEIARLPHSFEEGLTQVTATYSLAEDGSVKVINRGFDGEDNKWDEAEGKALFVEDEQTAHLKVSFFGPFYASYVVIALDEDYQYAMVTGPDRDYLWILSRNPSMQEDLLRSLVSKAEGLGYDTGKLIYVKQDMHRAE